MPFGLWKSRWEISREEWQEEARDLRRRSDEIRGSYERELAESRLFNRELLIRLEKTYAGLGQELNGLGQGLSTLGQEVRSLHKQAQDNNAAIQAQTEAILRLIDRFEETGGRPPV